MNLAVETLLTASAVLAAAAAILGACVRVFRWYDRQERQEEAIRAIKEEQGLLTCGVLACLKGLRERGCNGPVTEAIDRIERHLNTRAHK